MDTAIKDALAENAYIEAQEWLLELDRKVLDADVLEVTKTLMIDLSKAAIVFVTTFGGVNSFIDSLRGQVVRKGTLTVPQVRAALNVLQAELKKGTVKIARKDGRVDAPKLVENPVPSRPIVVELEDGQDEQDEVHRHRCYKCNRWFTSISAILAHKKVVHYGGSPVAVAVLKDHEVEESLLDVSALPDGRYAIPDPSGKNDFLFFAVRTVKKRTYRDRKYRYGKFRVGHQWIEAGTVEVRLWSQDAKKLVGAQAPGEGYRGEFVDQLTEIMMNAQAWATVFAHMIGCCSICGKTLTDDDSRERGIGPDCFKRWGMNYWTRFRRAKVVADAAADAAKSTSIASTASALLGVGMVPEAAKLLLAD